MKIFAALLGGLALFASCTKTVTQVQKVDQAFSAIYTLNPSGWSSSNGGLSYSTTLNVPELDNDIQNNGAVIVYLSFDNGSNYEAIPEEFDGISYGSVHSVGQVFLDFHDITGATVSPPGAAILAKVVLLHATALP